VEEIKHNCPSLIGIKSDKDPAVLFGMSDKPLKCQHLNEKILHMLRITN